MNNFRRLVLKAVEDNHMFNKGETVIVALSGGADSVSLLNALINIKDLYSLNIICAHINHNLRGAESDNDEQFVKDLCNKYKVKLFVKSVDVNALAKEQKISTELCGRNVRYDFLYELSEKYSGKIATAHTASDNAETLIFNLARGAGVKGMVGILPVRDKIIRPLIYITREEVERYCKDNNLDYVTDSSNLSDDYTRNKIRHHIVPKLKEINEDFENTALRQSRIFSDINTYIENETNKILELIKLNNGYDAKKITELPDSLKSSVIYAICKKANVKAEFCHINEILTILSGGAVNLPEGIRCVCKQNYLRFVKEEETKEDFFQIPFKLNEVFEYNGKKYVAKETSGQKNLIDISSINNNIVFRNRKAGDVFTFPNRKGTKTLKKLFNELKIPEEDRDKVLLLADENVILWIDNVSVSKKYLSKTNMGIKISIVD